MSAELDKAEVEFEESLKQVMDAESRVAPLRPDNQRAAQIMRLVSDDPERTSRSLREQVEKILPNLEAQLEESVRIRDNLNRRIANLAMTINASRSALNMLDMRTDS